MNFDLRQIITTFGYLGLFFIVFAESGLFFGFFLPGDSLLFTAGLLATKGIFKIELLVLMLVIAAVAGDTVGYWFGVKIGPKIFKKKSSFLFNPKHIERAHNFYEKYGAKTIVLARFIPIIRTFAPIVAGVAGMNYRKFFSYNVVGGSLWAAGMLLFGYFLGKSIPNVDRYLLPIIAIIVIISIAPPLLEYYKGKVKKD